MASKTVLISVRVKPDTKKWLEREAARKRQSVSVVVDDLILNAIHYSSGIVEPAEVKS